MGRLQLVDHPTSAASPRACWTLHTSHIENLLSSPRFWNFWPWHQGLFQKDFPNNLRQIDKIYKIDKQTNDSFLIIYYIYIYTVIQGFKLRAWQPSKGHQVWDTSTSTLADEKPRNAARLPVPKLQAVDPAPQKRGCVKWAHLYIYIFIIYFFLKKLNI